MIINFDILKILDVAKQSFPATILYKFQHEIKYSYEYFDQRGYGENIYDLRMFFGNEKEDYQKIVNDSYWTDKETLFFKELQELMRKTETVYFRVID